jgi:hypothetical protein
MLLALIAAASAAALFFCMVALIELGRRMGAQRLERDPEGMPLGAGAAEAAVFALLGLLIAFTFSGAAARFQDRKELIRQEANAIGTAWLRIDLLPGDAQPEMRQLFRRYADVRVVTYANVADQDATQARLAEGAVLQGEIWSRSVKACASPGAARDAALLLLPALNDMFDITTTRAMATRNHLPAVIFLLLVGMCFVGSLLIGYDIAGNKQRIRLHPWAYAAVLAASVYVIVDLEFPRLGLIQVGEADQILVEVRQSMR